MASPRGGGGGIAKNSAGESNGIGRRDKFEM